MSQFFRNLTGSTKGDSITGAAGTPASVSVIIAIALALVVVGIGFSIAILPLVIVLAKGGSAVAALSDAGAIVSTLSTPLLAVTTGLLGLAAGRKAEVAPGTTQTTTAAPATTTITSDPATALELP